MTQQPTPNVDTSKHNYTASIDLDATSSDLAKSWVNSNQSHVIRTLKNDHPGLTALLLVQHGPWCDGILTQGDCNSIANRLIDDRADRVIN